MKITRHLIVASILCVVSVVEACAQDAPGFPPPNGGQSISVPATSMDFLDRGFRGLNGSKITIVDAFGDGRDGKHDTFMKFAAGFVSHVHSHTFDYYAVVISGVMANYQTCVTPIKMGPGSYWYQKGHEPHTTACVSKEVCLAFVVQSRKFDVQDLDKAK